MNRYIRFGEIPLNERSGIYKGDEGKIGEEIGVSCYDVILLDNEYQVMIPLQAKRSTLVTLRRMIEAWEDGKRKCFLIEGKKIGHGSDNEPLVVNIKIVKQLFYKK